ncbi:hypothetical protein G3545_08635 [Starkeya sp. ORNL1]|uniref:hypothetical protein n=1 Tax=Starkeya sp. ORNL1 TaxID=2709380 RepID=UPI0014635CC5|nr:hypothetical protein [Starkeya sp. ORNL1]QJP13719.1 hypothetical protein G3545_08635 [Starkeya sp. ORNL1]
MPSEHSPAGREPIVTDEDLDAAIALCGGDPRLALRAMFIAYTMLQEQAQNAVSAGYVRRRRERTH